MSARPEVAPAAVIEQSLAQGEDARVDLTVNVAVGSDRVEGEAHARILEIACALSAAGLTRRRIAVESRTDGHGEALNRRVTLANLGSV